MQSINQLLTNSNTAFYRVWQHGLFLQRLTQHFQQFLPANLHPYCHLANLREQTLVIHVDAAIWGNQLRYLVPEILQQWQQHTQLPPVETIKIKVRPRFTPVLPPKSMPQLSSATTQLLNEVAATCPYPALQASLRKLAGNGQSN